MKKLFLTLSTSLLPVLCLAQAAQEQFTEQVAEEFFFNDDPSPAQMGTTADGERRFEIRSGYAIVEGDIVLGKISADGEDAPLLLPRGIGRNSKLDRWVDGLVYYQISPTLDANGRAKVATAVSHWNERSTVTLIERTAALANTVSDYILFEPSGGCASWVGKIGGEQAIWVGSTCTAGSVIHEIGHALGLFHEHTRSDRDSFINVQWDNIVDGKDFNFDVISSGATDLEAYDYGSIMHYGPRFFSQNGLDTIVVPDGVEIGQRDGLSQIDLNSINLMYGTNLALSSSVVSENNETVLNVTINNIGQNGAHDILFNWPVGVNTGTAQFNGTGWSCVSQTDEVQCSRATLAEGEESQLIVKLAGIEDTGSAAYISSKTHDTDLSNNGSIPIAPAPQPPVAPETAGDATTPVDQGEPEPVVPDNGGGTGGTGSGDPADQTTAGSGTDSGSGIDQDANGVADTPVAAPALPAESTPASSSGGGGGAGWPILLLPVLLWRKSGKIRTRQR